MSQQQLTTLVHALMASEQGWVPTLVIAFSILLGIGLVVTICTLALRWHNKAVRSATFYALMRMQIAMNEEQSRAQLATEQKQHELQVSLHSVWDAVNDLFFSLHGTTRDGYQFLCDIYQFFEKPMPKLEMKEVYRPYLVELMALTRALTGLGSMLDAARVELSDIEYFSEQVSDLKARYKEFAFNDARESYSIEMRLNILRAVHDDLGAVYGLDVTPAYRSFLGTLHVLEALVEERTIPAEKLWCYVDCLDTQLWNIRRSLPKEAAKKSAAFASTTI